MNFQVNWTNLSETGELGLRHKVMYKSIFMTPVNENREFFIQNFFELANVNKLYLPATDYARYRLYRIALNKFLDKSNYNLIDGAKNELVIEKII